MYSPEDYTVENVGATYVRMVARDGDHRIDIPSRMDDPDLDRWASRVMNLLNIAYCNGVTHGKRQLSDEIKILLE